MTIETPLENDLIDEIFGKLLIKFNWVNTQTNSLLIQISSTDWCHFWTSSLLILFEKVFNVFQLGVSRIYIFFIITKNCLMFIL